VARRLKLGGGIGISGGVNHRLGGAHRGALGVSLSGSAASAAALGVGWRAIAAALEMSAASLAASRRRRKCASA